MLLPSALYLGVVAFAVVVFARPSHSTNAERLKRGLPPLPPRGLVSTHKRHIRPTRPHYAREPCPSVTPFTCLGASCAYIQLLSTDSSTNYGYVAQVGVTPYFTASMCAASAVVFLDPEVPPDTLFILEQNTPINSDYPYFGLGGGDYDGAFDGDDSSDAVYMTSTTFEDEGNVQPGASWVGGGSDNAESLVWKFTTITENQLQLNWAPTGQSGSQTVPMSVLYDTSNNQLIGVSDPLAYSAAHPGDTYIQVVPFYLPTS